MKLRVPNTPLHVVSIKNVGKEIVTITESTPQSSDLETAEKAAQRIAKNAKSGNKDAVAEKDFLEELTLWLGEGKSAHKFDYSEKQELWAKQLHLLTGKPTMYIANVAEDGFENNELLDILSKYAKEEGALVVPVCASMEADITQLEADEKEEFLSEMGMTEPGLNRVIRAGYSLLGLQTFFTAGVKEVRAWTVKQGATAPNGAGRIHTDFEKGFIRAEVIAYEDFVEYKGESGAKDAGKWRLEGKEYILQEGDVVHFRFNV